MDDLFAWVVLAGFGAAVWYVVKVQNEQAQKGADQLVCPHCHERGHITAKAITKGKGISGGKATGALFTAGASMLFTGLSRNENMRRLHCSNCNMTWDVA